MHERVVNRRGVIVVEERAGGGEGVGMAGQLVVWSPRL